MKQVFRIAFATSLLLAAGTALAANDSPVGKWKQVDDVSGKQKSIIEITDNGGELQGKILELMNLSPQEIAQGGEHPKCLLCEGALKNQPIEGMTIMSGIKKDGDVWDGGKIVDPKSGKTYKVKLTLDNGGQKMDVRGYIGFSLLGRSQTWYRLTQ